MTDSWALVTGAARRLGASIAESLAMDGFNLHLHANGSADDLRELSEELSGKHGVEVRNHLADFRDAGAVRAFMSAIQGAGPRLKLIINNASVFGQYDYDGNLGLIATIEILTVNTAVPMVLASLVDPQDGHVINICDGHVELTCARHLPYDVSKAALADATRRLAVLLGPGIRVNAIGPGLMLPPPGADDRHLMQLAGRSPLRRPATVVDLVSAVRYLISSRSVTGQVIMVDSGEHLLSDGEALSE